MDFLKAAKLAQLYGVGIMRPYCNSVIYYHDERHYFFRPEFGPVLFNINDLLADDWVVVE